MKLNSIYRSLETIADDARFVTSTVNLYTSVVDTLADLQRRISSMLKDDFVCDADEITVNVSSDGKVDVYVRDALPVGLDKILAVYASNGAIGRDDFDRIMPGGRSVREE